MNGIQYEKACVRYLSHHGYHSIEMTPASGDQGIDIIAWRRRKKYGFQCKYYSRSVGNEAVQQAYAGKQYYDCDYAGVITNSTFTPSALRLAERTDVILLDEITPSYIYLPSMFLYAVCFFLCAYALGELLDFAPASSDYASLRAMHGTMLLIGSGACAFGERRYYVMLSAAVCLAASVVCGSALIRINPVLSFLAVMLVNYVLFFYAAVHLIGLIRIRTANRTALMKTELKQEMEETLRDAGIHFGSLLERDLHASLKLVNASRPESGVSEFIYQADRDVTDELVSIEILMNHTASVNGLSDRYSLKSLKNSRIKAVIFNEEKKADAV